MTTYSLYTIELSFNRPNNNISKKNDFFICYDHFGYFGLNKFLHLDKKGNIENVRFLKCVITVF